MDVRETAINTLAGLISTITFTPSTKHPMDCVKIATTTIVLPELEAYFREKFENEPGRLVAEKNTNEVVNGVPNIIRRRLTHKEIEEWAENKIADLGDRNSLNYNPNALMLPSGERIIVENK